MVWLLGVCAASEAAELQESDLTEIPLSAVAALWPPLLEQLESTKSSPDWFRHPSEASAAKGYSAALDHLLVLKEKLQPAEQSEHSTKTTEGFHAPSIAHSAFTLTTQTSNLKQVRRDGQPQVYVEVNQKEVNGIQTETVRSESLLMYRSDGHLEQIFSREHARVDDTGDSLMLKLEVLQWGEDGVLLGMAKTQLYCAEPEQPRTCQATQQLYTPAL